VNDKIAQMEILVSVITVSLNASETIGDTIKSVQEQSATFPIEHICVDGGSTDGTRELIIAATSGKANVTLIFEPDHGLFDAMNKGLRVARGTYVLFINADDYLIGATAIADAFLRVPLTTSLPDMVLADVIMGRPEKTGLWRMRKVPRWLPKYPTLGAHPPHQGSFISRKMLVSVGGFDQNQSLAADTTMFYRLAHEMNPSIFRTGTTLSFMRMGGASNKHMGSLLRGNLETYRHLRKYRSELGSILRIIVKLALKLSEYRFGKPTHCRAGTHVGA